VERLKRPKELAGFRVKNKLPKTIPIHSRILGCARSDLSWEERSEAPVGDYGLTLYQILWIS